MSQIPTVSTSTSNYQSIFDNALEAYEKKTKKDLRSHPLLSKLETCDSPDAVLSVLREQIPGFDQSRSTDERLTRWLNPTVNVLYTFSGTIGGAISSVNLGIQSSVVEAIEDLICILMQVYPPAAVIFTGMGVLLSVSSFFNPFVLAILTPNPLRLRSPFLLARIHS